MSTLAYSEQALIWKSETFCHKCKSCRFKTTSKLLFFNHSRRHELALKPFNCEDNSVELYHCEDCDLMLDTTIMFKKHIRDYHMVDQHPGDVKIENPTSYFCKKCSFQSHFILNWYNHVVKGCSLNCIENLRTSNKYFINFKMLPQILNSGEGHSQWFQCHHCDYKSKLKSSLRSHNIYKHLPNNEIRWFCCDKCDYSAKSRAQLRRHVQFKHFTSGEIQWFHCDKCDHKTKTKYDLKSHVRNKHLRSDEIKWFFCDICDYKAKKKYHLIRHVHGRHLGPDEIQWLYCEECDFKTKTKFNLKLHVLNKHGKPDEIQWFQCDKCDYKTVAKCTLNKHEQRKHLIYEWIYCDQCDYKAKTNPQLNRHITRRHL